MENDEGRKKFRCPTFGAEGVTNPYPAGEICPCCRREKGMLPNQCNFSLMPLGGQIPPGAVFV